MIFIRNKKKIDRRLLTRIQNNADETVSAIIMSRDLKRFKNQQVLKDCDCVIKYDLEIIDAIAVEIPASKISKLSESADVRFIAADSQVNTQMDIARGSVSSNMSENYGYSGEGIGVAILDTGVYPHEDLVANENRIVAFKDFVNNYTSPYDDNGHGTHVAGIVAGDGKSSKGKYKGIAPKSHIIGVKVMNSKGGGATSDIVAGMQWVLKNKDKYNIKIMSLSLGSNPDLKDNEDPLVKGVNAVWSKGVVVVTAAGNSGPSDRTINSPGISTKVITVGCSDAKGTIELDDDTIAEFSSRGPTNTNRNKPDLVAPGVKVQSLKANKEYTPLNNPSIIPKGRDYIALSGTSMSTPIVSGAIALLLEKDSSMNPEVIKKKLLRSTVKIEGSKYDQGQGCLNIKMLLS